MNHPFDLSPLLPQREPNPELLGRVISRLNIERQRRMLRQRMAFFSLLGLAAAVFLIPAWQYFRAEALQTGFSQYAAFAAYDLHSAAAYWRYLSLSLLESMPALSLAVFLAVVLALFVSIKSVFANRQAWQRLIISH